MNKSLYTISLLAFAFSPLLNAKMHRIDLAKHPVPEQELSWDCGPNSGAKMLWHFHGYKNFSDIHGNNYELFRDSCPKTINGAAIGSESVGPSPVALAQYMTAHSKTHQFSPLTMSSAEIVLKLASQQILKNNPVIANIQNDSFSLVERLPAFAKPIVMPHVTEEQPIMVPVLHYIVLNGYDPETKEFLFVDTRGGEKKISFEDLAKKIDWKVNVPEALVAAAMGFGFMAQMLNLGNLGDLLTVKGNTIIVGTKKA